MSNWFQRSRVQPHWFVAGACLLLSIWSWTAATATDAKRHRHRNLVEETERMSADASRIEQLRTAPRLASDRERPNDELLAQVRDALTTSGIGLEHWIGNDPTPSARIPKTPYKRMSVRVRMEDLSMRQLVLFAYHLTSADPTISISSLHLSGPSGRSDDLWNADVTLSYLLFSPHTGQ